MTHVFRCYGYELMVDTIVRAEDCRLFDASGRRFVDFEAGVWCAAAGHNHPRIAAAIERQVRSVSHLGYRVSAPIVEEAAEANLEIPAMPGGACVFLSSGSEAVELAAQMAKRATGRPRLVSLHDSYLGAYGTVGRRTKAEWLTFDWGPCPRCTDAQICPSHKRAVETIPGSDVAAFLFEPGNSSGLIHLPPVSIVRALHRRVADAGGLLVVDEVTTGMGRTGRWLGVEHYGLYPDLVALGKGLGNGYPVSAVAMTGDIVERLQAMDFRWAQSHQDDPMGCAVAKEVVGLIADEGLVRRSERVGADFLEGLRDLAARHSVIRDVRGRGLMLAAEFCPDTAAFSLAAAHRRLLDLGFLVGFKPAARLLRFYPPLTIPEEDIRTLLASLDKILADLHPEAG